MELGATELAEQLIDLVLLDTELRASVHERVRGLRALAEPQPDLAFARLQDLAAEYADRAKHREPKVQLAKAVTVEAYWKHYLDADAKAAFADPEAYRRYLMSANDPQQRAQGDARSDGVLVPAPHSWLAPYPDVRSLSGSALIDALELGSSRRPPLLLLVLVEEGLADLGVQVRRPRGTGAAASRQPQWRPAGLASGIEEFIDRDVPAEALAEVEWRP